MSKVITPQYWIYIKGKEIPSDVYPFIDSVKIKKTFHGASKGTIKIIDPDLVYLQDDLFVESTPVTIKYGVSNSNTIYVFDGFVSVIDADFPDKGTPSIIINCMDKSHIMNRKEKTRTWTNKKASDVAKEIFRSHGFKDVVEDTGKVLESIEQSNETDIEFLVKLAKDVDGFDFICYVEGESAYFVKRNLKGSPSHTLTYRQSPYNLLSFKPRINKESKKVQRMNYDIDIKSLKVVPTLVNPKYDKLGKTQVHVTESRK